MKISGKTNNISYAHANDGGADLRSNEDTIICAGSQTLVHTGVHMAIPAGYVGLICPRSGLALKHNITVMNAPGVIDANYRGEVGVILRNMGEQACDILPRLMRGGGFLLKNPNGFSINRLSPHALWFARCFTSRAARRFFWLRPGCSGRRSCPGRA